MALSGGLDSTALLAALAAHRPRSLHLRAVHVDHGLHPDSGAWSTFCRSLAAGLHVPLTVHVIRVVRERGVSLEAAAREQRYAALAGTLEAEEILLTAHHEDDQLETVLLQLFRGAGLAGLAAMPELAPFAGGSLARPLLSRSRAELEAWARAQGLSWVEDQTNADEQLDRNYLRRRVLPAIRQRWQGVGAAVSRSSRHAAEGQRILDMVARSDVDRAASGAALSVKTLRALSPERRRNALRFWIDRSGHQAPDTRRLDELAGPLILARPDANPVLRWGVTVVHRHADLLRIEGANAASTPPEPIEWFWRRDPVLLLPGGRGRLELKPDPRGPVNLHALPDTLMIRPRAGGERIRPRRGGPRRALKGLLQEARLPLVERAALPLIFSGTRLLAAAGLWLDESIQAVPGAGPRGRLRWIPSA